MVVDILTFRLAPDATEEAFLEADRQVQQALIPNQPGFARRTTARGPDGEWLVMTVWWSAEAADAFDRLWETDEVARGFRRLIEHGGAAPRRFTTLD